MEFITNEYSHLVGEVSNRIHGRLDDLDTDEDEEAPYLV